MSKCKIKLEHRKADEGRSAGATDDQLLQWIPSQIAKMLDMNGLRGAGQRNYNALCRREARRRGLKF